MPLVSQLVRSIDKSELSLNKPEIFDKFDVSKLLRLRVVIPVPININCIEVTIDVSKLDKSRLVSKSVDANIEPISVTFEVLKLLTLRDVRALVCANIPFMLITFEVLKLDIFRLVSP